MSRFIILILLLQSLRPYYGAKDSLMLSEGFIIGADLSYERVIRHLGGNYLEECVDASAMDILQTHDMNWVRLRIWHTPVNGRHSLEMVWEQAQSIYDRNLKFLLDFHYSDTWADPGNQQIPQAWASLSFEEMVDSLRNYTRYVVESLFARNTPPHMIQLGNEIDNGLLWPVGQGWDNIAEFLIAGREGVIAAGGEDIPIMLHLSYGGWAEGVINYLTEMEARNFIPQIIGLSYYPWWHGSFQDLQQTMDRIVNEKTQDILIVETAYPWTLDWADAVPNFVGSENQLPVEYPPSVEGQRDFLFELISRVNDLPDQRGLGIMYWEPDLIPVEGIPNPYENLTLFDFSGNLLKPDPILLNETQVTFKVDMSYLAPDEYQQWGISIRGNTPPLNWWWDHVLTDPDGDGIYETVLVFQSDIVEYKYVIPQGNTILWEGGENRRLYPNYQCDSLTYHHVWDRNTGIPLMGDLDHSGLVDVIDIILLVSRILGETEFTAYQTDASDMNGDGAADVQDIIILVEIILGEG